MWYQWLGEAAGSIAYGVFDLCDSLNHCYSTTQYRYADVFLVNFASITKRLGTVGNNKSLWHHYLM